MKTILDDILRDVRTELESSRVRRPAAEIRRMIPDAVPPRAFDQALSHGFRLIAEVKERSPSVGPMREANVGDALPAYEESAAVAAVSVLTNSLHFGMSIERLAAARARLTKPVLRKDFFLDEYQIREARAFGADAVLLMANVLDQARLQGFYDLTRELGMEALFEVHTADELDLLPLDAKIVGINSRKFKTTSGFVGKSGASDQDFSLDYSAFELADKLPASAIKVAESGISPSNLGSVRKRFHAVLVGTSLLRDPRGLRACLAEFEEAMGEE
jgi:indole-3-glycerol phosphate synthase